MPHRNVDKLKGGYNSWKLVYENQKYEIDEHDNACITYIWKRYMGKQEEC